MRLHLFEFGDMPWLPGVLRSAETGYLAACYRQIPLPREWAAKIASATGDGPIEILDLCSGSGGAAPLLVSEFEKIGREARITLSDRYPNPDSARHPRIRWFPKPLDAMRVPSNLPGVRTMCAAFHHFRPEQARAILEDAFRSRRTICVFEAGQGGITGVLTMLVVPLNVLLVMPAVRPFRWSYALFTYLIPILPLMVFWDGMISMLRIYTPEVMRAMTAGLDAPDYVWETGRLKVARIPGGLPYLIGRAVQPRGI